MIGSQRHNHMSYFDGESRFLFRGGLALLCRPGLPQNSVDQEDTMKSHRVAGGGGAEMNVVEWWKSARACDLVSARSVAMLAAMESSDGLRASRE